MPRLPKVKVDDPQWEWYRAEEARRLVAAARDEWERALLRFPLAMGARMGENIAIRGPVRGRGPFSPARQSGVSRGSTQREARLRRAGPPQPPAGRESPREGRSPFREASGASAL